MTRRKIGSTFAVLALSAVLVAACASSAERPGAQVTISTDEFSKTVELDGPPMKENPFFGIGRLYGLVTRVDKQTGAYRHVISVDVLYEGDPLDFIAAADDTAQSLPLLSIFRTRGHLCDLCSRHEAFDIAVTDAALRAHAASGYRVKISARSGAELILTITPAMIAAQFAGLDEFLRTGTISQR